MLNHKKLLTALAIAYTCSLVPSGRDTTTCSNVVAGTNQNVKGQTTNCTGGADEGGIAESLIEGFNSFKDKVSWTVKRNTPKQDLGKITANKEFELMYPAVGKMKQVSFTPTMGSKANTKINILFVSFSIYDTSKNLELPADETAKKNLNDQLAALKNSSSPFLNLIKVYRKIGTERQWEERAELYTKNDPASDKMAVTWILMPNGMVKADEPLYQTDVNGKTTEYPGNTFDLTMMD